MSGPERAPRVTVVVPVYNAAATLAETLDSLFAQSFTDFEALIVDDGSPDRSMEIVARYTDPRLRTIRQENRGLNGARNSGIRHGRGAFIAFLDADDLWEPEMLARHVGHLDAAPEVGISYSPSELIGEDGRRIGIRQTPKLTDVTIRDIVCRNPIGNGSAAVFRRDVFDGVAFRRAETPPGETWWFDETFRQSTDIECWLRIAAQTTWRFEGVPETLVRYRVSSGGLSANTERQLHFWERALARFAELQPDAAARWGGLARAYQYRYLARRAVSARDGKRAVALMRRAMREDARILREEPSKTLTTIAAAQVLAALDGLRRFGLSAADKEKAQDCSR